MKKSRFGERQIMSILKQAEGGGCARKRERDLVDGFYGGSVERRALFSHA